jgi:hypothetical protein
LIGKAADTDRSDFAAFARKHLRSIRIPSATAVSLAARIKPAEMGALLLLAKENTDRIEAVCARF